MISQKIPSFNRLCAESELSYTVRFSEYKAHSPERGRSSYGSRPPCFRFTERFHSHLAFAPCSCRAMCVFALLRSCVQARTAQYATSTLFLYERCHSHSAVAPCSCRAVALCGCLHTALVRASPHRAVCNIHAPLVDTRQFCSAFINAGISCFFLETTFGRYATSFSSTSVL